VIPSRLEKKRRKYRFLFFKKTLLNILFSFTTSPTFTKVNSINKKYTSDNGSFSSLKKRVSAEK